MLFNPLLLLPLPLLLLSQVLRLRHPEGSALTTTLTNCVENNELIAGQRNTIKNKKIGGVIVAELVQSSRLPQLTSFSCGFVHSTSLAGGLPHGLSWPPRFSQSTVFFAETSLPHYPKKGQVREPELLRC